MQWRRFLLTAAALLLAVIRLAGVTNPAHAAPHAGLTVSPPKEGTKVTFGETSIDGPAISDFGGFIAWTGTDSAHHLNVASLDSKLHLVNKHTLPETSLWRPAVRYEESVRGAPYGTLYLAWSGADPAHTLNIIQYRMMGQTRAKHTFWGWSSISRPDLSNNPLNLAWTGRNYHLYFANSTDGVHWTMPSSSPLAHQSAWAPSMFEFSAVTPDHWLAWTGSGTTSTRNLNVQYTQHYPNWSDPGSTATFGETAISSPELAAYGYQVLLAWTGTDSAHRLNVAVVSVTS